MKKAKNNTRIIVVILLAFCIISGYLGYILKAGAGAEYNQMIGILGFSILLMCALSTKLMYGKLFVLIFLFELSFYILTEGQSFLHAFKIPLNNSTLDLYRYDAAETVNEAYIYNCFCMMVFHLATLGHSRRRIRLCFGGERAVEKQSQSVDYTNAMRSVGWIIFLVSIIPYFIEMYELYATYKLVGYSAAYLSVSGNTSWSKILTLVASYFVISAFLLLSAYKSDKTMRSVLSVIIYIIALLNFVIGNRSEPICYLFALYWFKQTYPVTDSEKKTTRVVIALFVIVLFLIIPIIGATRNSGALTLATIVSSLTGTGSAINLIKETFISMGWSAFPLIKTMQLIPSSVGYHYGQSYFFAMLSVIPNLIGGTHISVKYAGLPQWLMNTLNMTYGPGYSMPAEAYYNFGWFGILMMYPIGRVIKKLLDEEIEAQNDLKVFAKMGLFVILFSIPRREMLTAIRNSTYYVGLVYVAVVLLNTYFARSRYHQQELSL